MKLYIAYAGVITGPGLGTEAATIGEVKAALKAAGMNTNEVEAADPDSPSSDGLYVIPLSAENAEKLKEEGHLEFSLEIPEAGREERPRAKQEFLTHVNFELEMP